MRRFDRPEGEEPPPKPYAFVPIPDSRVIQKHPAGHDLYKEGLLTGTVTATLVALSPVHVASGNVELTGAKPSLVKAHFRRNGRPTIPGSSLKGAIRSIVEAISDPPSCVRITKAPSMQLPPGAEHCRKKERLCVACRMFGAMDYMGQVRFADALLASGETEIAHIPSLFAPRTRERVYLDRGVVKGRKFYAHGQRSQIAHGNVPVEVCPAGSRFPLAVHFENLEARQLALLLTALGQGQPRLFPKLGGGKPACCGSVEVKDVAVTVLPVRASALDFESEPRREDLAALLAAGDAINRDSLESLAQILKYPGERECQSGSY
ncbi:MAG TPA: RAMP superfamily CRISPR-associated protein [Pyrinomonadaceae bacterium]|nr:RAMP superfamily CRISPR-associated protein [Pyrinomonadaceae bacterium]